MKKTIGFITIIFLAVNLLPVIFPNTSGIEPKLYQFGEETILDTLESRLILSNMSDNDTIIVVNYVQIPYFKYQIEKSYNKAKTDLEIFIILITNQLVISRATKLGIDISYDEALNQVLKEQERLEEGLNHPNETMREFFQSTINRQNLVFKRLGIEKEDYLANYVAPRFQVYLTLEAYYKFYTATSSSLSREENLKKFEEHLDNLLDEADIIIIPSDVAKSFWESRN